LTEASPIRHRVWRPLSRLPAEIVFVIALGAAVFATGINRAPLLDWDEATYAQVAHEAGLRGSYFDFTWNDSPYLKKPPLLFWAVAGSFRSFGESEFAARFPSMLSAILTMLLLYASGYEAGGRIAGFFASILPLGFYFFVARGGRQCATDPLLVTFSTLALYATLRGRFTWRWQLIAGAAVGMAVLSKGAAGLIPLIVIAIAVGVIPEFSSIGVVGLATILGVAVAVAGPWYLYEALYNPLFWKSFVAQETLRRLATHLEDEIQPGNYTVVTFLNEMYWLLPIAIPLGVLAITNARKGWWNALRKVDPAIRLWMIWLIVAFAAACAVQTKLPWYVLPALIPGALLAGTILASAFNRDGPSRRLRMASGVAAIMLLIAEVPGQVSILSNGLAQERADSLPNFSLALKAREAALTYGIGELYFAGVELPVLVYYSGMHCNFVKPADATRVGLGRANQAPISMRPGDLVLVPLEGEPVLISNLNDEWGLSPAAPLIDE
jgi:4-amino-4-deoxy-L-arabinose transferase-like glycosyltransferase